MNKKKKTSVPINVRLDTDINDRITAYCDDTGVTKTFVIEKAITAYLDKQEAAVKIARKLTEDEDVL